MDYNTIISEAHHYIEETQKGSKYLVVCYRGQSQNWALKSKLQRLLDNGELVPERKMDWDNSHSAFENIARFQHYGEATRLLDYSTDIDVALYFACSKDMDKDGVLYLCSYLNHNPNTLDVLIMSEIMSLKQEIRLIDFVKHFICKYPQYPDSECIVNKVDGVYYVTDPYYIGEENLALDILKWIDHGFMVIPSDEDLRNIKKWNPRLYSQKGAFFITGNKIIPEKATGFSWEIPNIVILPQLADLPSTITTSRDVNIIKIPAGSKQEILYILKNKGITAQTLHLET